MPNREKAALREKLREEAYQEWLIQPPIQFPLHPNSQLGMTTTIVVLYYNLSMGAIK